MDTSTDELRGGDLYHRYCASCHGVNGQGDGPLARLLQVDQRPADEGERVRQQGVVRPQPLASDLERLARSDS